MSEQMDDGSLLDIDFLDWANEWVGKRCLRCETEIRYSSLGMVNGQNQYRLECDCVVIESTAKDERG